MAARAEAKAEGFLRGACALLAAAAALLVGLSTQTETVLLVRKKATVKDVQALWVLAVAAGAAAGYHLLQLFKCFYLSRFAESPCRNCKAMAWTCLLLDKADDFQYQLFRLASGANGSTPQSVRTVAEQITLIAQGGYRSRTRLELDRGPLSLPTTRATDSQGKTHTQTNTRSLFSSIWNGANGKFCKMCSREPCFSLAVSCLCNVFDGVAALQGCAYMTFATTVAAMQACMVALDGEHALQWTRLCNIYTRFCEQVAGSLACGMLAAAGTALLSAVSARNLFRLYPSSHRASLSDAYRAK